jgi:hypothetical protein
LEGRTLDDIRALGTNPPEDELRFATAARVSEINLGLYQTLWAPAVRMMSTPQSAELLRSTHPNRVRFGMFGEKNPFMRPVPAMAEAVRANRLPVAVDNPFLVLERTVSEWIVAGFETWTKIRDGLQEAIFLNLYGLPLLQAAVGLGTEEALKHRRRERELLRAAEAARAAADLARRVGQGGPLEAAIRALLYIRLPARGVDERGFLALKEVGATLRPEERVGLGRLKEIFRDQFLILKLDEQRAMAELPGLLPVDRSESNRWMAALRRIAAATGEPTGEARRRLQEIEALYAAGPPAQERGEADVKRLHAENSYGTGAKPAA